MVMIARGAFFVFICCALVGGIGAGTALGYSYGRANAIRTITQHCSADGAFEIERSGIAWVYTCSKPKLAPIEPWSE